MGLKVLYSHRGRARSTWIVSDGNSVTTVRAVLKAINIRTGMYSYQVILNDMPKFVVEVPGPRASRKRSLRH